jgi:hypothetical protein
VSVEATSPTAAIRDRPDLSEVEDVALSALKEIRYS